MQEKIIKRMHGIENVFLINLSIDKRGAQENFIQREFLGITITRYTVIKYADINMRGDIIFY